MTRRRERAPVDLVSFARPGSLRFKALMAVVLIVLAPLAWVWGTTLWDTASQVRMARDLDATAANLARNVRAGTLNTEVAASSNRVRIRLFDAEGALLEDVDREGSQRWHDRVTEVFFGPEGRPDPAALDATRAAVWDRPEMREAVVVGRGQACAVLGAFELLGCAVARRVDGLDGVRFLHVQGSAARSTRALYADRFQLLQLTLYVLLFAVLATLWLGTRWVRPMESLRDQALERTRGKVSTEPLVVDRNDEYGELADAFNTLLSALDSRNRANETFAADLAHELKNPIAAVLAASEALEPGRPLTEARAARLHRILSDSSERMAVVIDRFLELARAEAGLSNRTRELVDLEGLVNGIVNGHRADERFADVTFVLDVVPAVVVGTAERLETTVRNLVSNAACFAAPSGTVTVRVRSSGDEVVVEVSDTGPGITAADLPRVFDRYFSKRQGGTGLGLALSRAIAEAHGGTLTVRSPPGEGAEFTLVLPV